MEFALGWDGNNVVLYEVLSIDLELTGYIKGPNNFLSWLSGIDEENKQYARNFLTNIHYPYTE